MDPTDIKNTIFCVIVTNMCYINFVGTVSSFKVTESVLLYCTKLLKTFFHFMLSASCTPIRGK